MSQGACRVILSALLALLIPLAFGMDASRSGSLPGRLFPEDNWWNQDIRAWPVDANSADYIAFINGGGTRSMHPDFGGNSGNGFEIYGMPYAVVGGVGSADLQIVNFYYSDESDGVDHAVDRSVPFYPIPPAAIAQPYWVEGGDPGNVDLRDIADRHLLIVDRDRNFLYELYNVYYDGTQRRWYAGSGAFFDMNGNSRRPDGWTSADAAGLAILPGLVRYDEVYNSAVSEIRHAFRVTVRATNGYVYPASHRAGSTTGALPMGARLRLKSSIDVTRRTDDPNVQKIFRAFQTYGLIVADNGSDLYVTGTYDTRWNNDILNPAFRNLTASDFEVIRLGYNPSASPTAIINGLTVSPSVVAGGQPVTGTVGLSGKAPAGGAAVMLTSANPAVSVPSSVTVPAGEATARFSAATRSVAVLTTGNITARYGGSAKTAAVTVKPLERANLSSVTLNPSTVAGGKVSVGTIRLTGAAPPGGLSVKLVSSKPSRVGIPSAVTVPQGASATNFSATTSRVARSTSVTVTAVSGATRKVALLTIKK